jgi:hypothetical protein
MVLRHQHERRAQRVFGTDRDEITLHIIRNRYWAVAGLHGFPRRSTEE